MRPWGNCFRIFVGVVAALVANPLAAQVAPMCGAPVSRDPSWTPDGSRLVFSSDRTGTSEIWTVDVDGGDARQLTRAGTRLHYPFVSPDGRHVVFSVIDSLGMRVGIVDAAGGEVRHLTEVADNAADPSWSPDGRVVFSSARGGQRDLWIMTVDGESRRLFALDGDEWAPRFSPGGDRIAFATNRDGNGEVYSARLDGSDLLNLSRDPAWDGIPSWSRRNEVAFYNRVLPEDTSPETVRASWGTAELRSVSAQGGEVRRLTANDIREQSPSWSPDGTRLAYASCASGNLEVWVTDADGRRPRQVTKTLYHADSVAVESAVRGYVEGWRDGDVARLASVMASDGVILWPSESGLESMTFGAALENRRPNPGYGLPWRLLKVDVVDRKLAVAHVFIALAESGREYTDVLTLYNIDGAWKIVGKAFSLRGDGG